MPISDNIKKLRTSHGLSQTEFGAIAGVSDKAVSTWENGEKTPRMGAIQKLADHFGISKSEIIEDSPLNIICNISSAASSDEQELLNDYRLLNDLGKGEARKRINELTKLEQYNSSDDSEGEVLIPIAARKARTTNRKLKKRNSNIMPSDLPDYKG